MAQLRSDMAGLHPEALRLLDFGGKGLKNVVVGLNLPESVSGDAVLYTRNDAWKFVDDLGRREDGEEGVVFPVKVKFRVALASGPQGKRSDNVDEACAQCWKLRIAIHSPL